MITKTISTIAELHQLAEEVLASFIQKESATVVGLTGDLGVGKTAFVKEIAQIMAVPNEIISPTFVIMKSYPIFAHPFFKILTHIDAYRIEADNEMEVLKFNTLLIDPTRLIIIEWSERIIKLLPQDMYPIIFINTQDTKRIITYGK